MGMFDWVEFEGKRYQSKDTPNQLCDEYRIDENGVLWVEEYDAEFVKDPAHLFGVYLNTSNHRWRSCDEFSGTIRFYREDREHGGYDENAWNEWEAEFKCGLMINLQLIEGERFIEWYRKGLEERGLE